MNNIEIGTTWHWEHWLKGQLLNKWVETNLCVLEGRNHVLESAFAGLTQIGTWYITPFEDNHTPASGDSYATPGFTECTDYEGTRPGWQPGSVVGGVVDNASNRASFTFTAAKTIYGAAMVGGGSSPTTVGDTAGGGVLFCESKFSAPEAVVSGSVLKVKVELTITAA